MNKRKSISPKVKLEVLKRGNYTCSICGRSPVTNPGLPLEVDHEIPFSKDGPDEISNYQILCMDCNRGKGANEILNRSLKNDLDIILNNINPLILETLRTEKQVRVVANQEEFSQIINKNGDNDFYHIEVIPNTIMGYHAGYNLGIYTQKDNGGSKINFIIRLIIDPSTSNYA